MPDIKPTPAMRRGHIANIGHALVRPLAFQVLCWRRHASSCRGKLPPAGRTVMADGRRKAGRYSGYTDFRLSNIHLMRG